MKRTERQYDKHGILRSEVVVEEDARTLQEIGDEQGFRFFPDAPPDARVVHLLVPDGYEECGRPDCTGCQVRLGLAIIEKYNPRMAEAIEELDDALTEVCNTESMDERQEIAEAYGSSVTERLLEAAVAFDTARTEEAAASQDFLRRMFPQASMRLVSDDGQGGQVWAGGMQGAEPHFVVEDEMAQNPDEEPLGALPEPEEDDGDD